MNRQEYYIKDWGRYGAYFDDYKNEILYDYKGPYGNLIKKKGSFMIRPHWSPGIFDSTKPERLEVQQKVMAYFDM